PWHPDAIGFRIALEASPVWSSPGPLVYVDDVTVSVACGTPTATPSPSPAPTLAPLSCAGSNLVADSSMDGPFTNGSLGFPFVFISTLPPHVGGWKVMHDSTLE